MLAAIQLDNDGRFQANEVTDIRSDWTLAAKFKAVQLTSSQALPWAALSVGGAIAQFSGVVVHQSMVNPRYDTSVTLIQTKMALLKYRNDLNRCVRFDWGFPPPALRATSPV